MSINVFPPVISGSGSSSGGGLFSRAALIDSSQTWSHPDGYASPRIVAVFAVGGGGGGGSGGVLRVSSSHIFAGGGGGGGTGGFSVTVFRNLSDLTITIGAGGAGGAGVTTTTGNVDGNTGSNGGTTSIAQNSVTLVSCTGGSGGLRGQATSSSTSITLNATTYYLGGAGGTPSGLSGGNGGFTSNGTTSGTPVNAASGDALTNIFQHLLLSSNPNFPFPDLTLNQNSPSGGPGGGSRYYDGTAEECLAADGLLGTTDLYNLAVTKLGSAGQYSNSAVNLTSDDGADADLSFTYGGGGGGSGGVFRRASTGSNTLTSGAGGNGGDGAVWIFY